MKPTLTREGNTVTATYDNGTTTSWTMKTCDRCGKEYPSYCNYCDDWDCNVAAWREQGNPEHLPNGLPVCCVKADGTMLEHEHGDHPDYIFPVDVEYCGPDKDERVKLIDGDGNVFDGDDDDDYVSKHETHALLYANGSVAVTMYETCSAMWYLHKAHEFKPLEGVKGLCMGGHLWESNAWKLTDESIEKIKEYVKKKRGEES